MQDQELELLKELSSNCRFNNIEAPDDDDIPSQEPEVMLDGDSE